MSVSGGRASHIEHAYQRRHGPSEVRLGTMWHVSAAAEFKGPDPFRELFFIEGRRGRYRGRRGP